MPKKFHPLADVFPLLDGEEFEALANDIKAHGLCESITLHPDGSILDGRNRYRACLGAGVDPRFVTWDERGSITAFILSKNLIRRQLNTSQRAMVGAKMANMRQGARTDLEPSANWREVSETEAAQLLNVGVRSVERAKKVLDNGTPEICEAVERGKITLHAAEKMTPRKERIKSTKKRTRKNGQKKQYAALWRQLRDSLENLNGLPDIETMVNTVPAAQRDLVCRRLPVVLAWLGSFAEAWNTKMEGNEK